MQFSSFGRLVNLYERGLKSLFSHWASLNEDQRQKASFRLGAKVAQGSAKANFSSWRTAAHKLTRAGTIYRALKKEIAPIEPALQQVARNNATLISNLASSLRQQITEKAAELQRQGLRGKALENEIRRIAPQLTKSRIKLIARTEISKAETDLTRARSENLGIGWYQWQSSEDSRVRRSHNKMNGVLVAWNDPPRPEALVNEPKPPNAYHAGQTFNCFPEDTLVQSQSGIQTLWRAPYSGDLVTIVLKNGVCFSATPNHPVLTRYGWVPVSLLDIGDDLFHLGSTRNPRIESDVDLDVASFDEVFTSFTAQVRMNRVRRPAMSFNFYGDVLAGDVDEISVADLLRNYRQPDFPACFGNFPLPYTNRGVCDVVPRIPLHVLSAHFSRSRDEGFSAFGVHLLHSNLISLLNGAQRYCADNKISTNGFTLNSKVCTDSCETPFFFEIEPFENGRSNDVAEEDRSNICFVESFGNYSSVPSVTTADAIERFTRLNLVVNVVEKRVRKFSGHVFTMQTGEGFYHVSPTRIIARNCRCLALPLVSLDEVKWPARVHINGRIQRMRRVQFAKYSGVKQ